MRIKEVKTKDLRKIIKLEKKIFKKNAFSKNLLRKLTQQNLIFHKIESDGLFKKLLGFIIVIRDMKNRANLINFVINPKYQGKGYGSFLLNNTLKIIQSKSKEIKKIILNVNIDNINAIRLYKKFDFQIVSKIEKYYQNGDAAYLMELNLTSENE